MEDGERDQLFYGVPAILPVDPDYIHNDSVRSFADAYKLYEDLVHSADYEPIALEEFFFNMVNEDLLADIIMVRANLPDRKQKWEVTEWHHLQQQPRRPVALSFWNPRFSQREYVVDSGASLHTVAFNTLSKEELKAIRYLPEPIVMETVNGETTAEEETDIYVHSLKTFVPAVVLHNDTPALLSVGNLAKDNHIYFSWHESGPTLTLPSGAVVACDLGCNVPMILVGKRKKTKKKTKMVPAAVSPAADANVVSEIVPRNERSGANGTVKTVAAAESPDAIMDETETPATMSQSISSQSSATMSQSISSQSSAAMSSPTSSRSTAVSAELAPSNWEPAADPPSKTKRRKVTAGEKGSSTTVVESCAGKSCRGNEDLLQDQSPNTTDKLKKRILPDDIPPHSAENSAATAASRKRRRYQKTKWGRAAPMCQHNIFTHFPKDPNCPVCQKSKATKARCSRKSGESKVDSLPKPKEFGEFLTADHMIFGDGNESRNHDTVALVIQDSCTYWLQAYPAQHKSADECYAAFRRFIGVGKEAGHVYSDVYSTLLWPHDASTPNRPATNGLAERAVKRTKEGTSATLQQSGLDEQWWDLAMRCYCFLRNIIDELVIDTPPNALRKQEQANPPEQIPAATAYKQRFHEDFRGPTYPFGAKVFYKPSGEKDCDDMPRLGTKLRAGIFVGYDQIVGGGWSGDLYVLDALQLGSADSIHRAYVRRIKADEVFIEKDDKDRFIFPSGNRRAHSALWQWEARHFLCQECCRR